MPAPSPPPSAGPVARHAQAIRLVSIALTIAGLALTGLALPLRTLAGAFIARVEAMGSWGPLIYLLGYVVGTLLWLPGGLLAAVGGILFGVVWGSALACVGSVLGAGLAFVAARYLARSAIERYARRSPRFAAIDQAVGQDGWRVVLFLRLAPGVPYGPVNYMLGLTAIAPLPWLVATLLGTPPGAIVYAALGAAGARGLGASAPSGFWAWAGLIGGVASLLAAAAYMAHLARRALAKAAPALAPHKAIRHLRHREPSPAPPPAASSPGLVSASLWALAAFASLALAGAAWLWRDALGAGLSP